MQKISLIAAIAKNRVIGDSSRIPWRLPADLAHFKALTIGKPIIMGRATFESIGKPLKDRINIVITRDVNYKLVGCVVVHSVKDALDAAGNAEEIMVIGGGQIYSQFLPYASRMYLTLVDHEFPGDVFFPEWDAQDWTEISIEEHLPNEKNPYHYSFVVLERK